MYSKARTVFFSNETFRSSPSKIEHLDCVCGGGLFPKMIGSNEWITVNGRFLCGVRFDITREINTTITGYAMVIDGVIVHANWMRSRPTKGGTIEIMWDLEPVINL